MLFSHSVNQIYLLIRTGLMYVFLKKELFWRARRTKAGEARPVPCWPQLPPLLLHQPAMSEPFIGFTGAVPAASSLYGLPAITPHLQVVVQHRRVPLAGGLIFCTWKGLSVVGTMQFIPPLNSRCCFSEEALECSSPRLCSQLLPAALSLACGRST